MSKLPMTFAGRDYDRTRALIDGRVSPRGIDLNYLLEDEPDSIFRRMINWEEFDASEFSLSSYIAIRGRRDKRFTAIPVFPSRLFRHSYIICNSEAKIREPRDMIGKRVGIMEWQQTATVWIKGILQHEYDVPLRRIRWIRFKPERYMHVKPKKFRIEPMSNLDPENAEERAGKALEDGVIDVLLTARLPSAFYKSKKIRRLFKDYVNAEAEYFRKTGIFPIMHTVAIRSGIYEKNPWVARSLLDAFKEAKEMGTKYLQTSGDKVSYVWARSVLEKQLEILGRDPYPYNIKDNRKVIETLIQYQLEQEIIDREISVEELFAPNTIDS